MSPPGRPKGEHRSAQHEGIPVSHFCPVYPKPRASKASRWWLLFDARRSWLDNLYERSYAMKMGEIRLPGSRLYMVNEPALVRRVLVERAADYPKHRLMGDALRPLLGDSIFTTSGAAWQRQRDMMNPAFAEARIDATFPQMLRAVQAMTERLDDVADGAVHDVEAEMTHVTADIIFRTIFSTPLEGADARRMFDAFARFQVLAPRIAMPALYGLGWMVPFWQTWQSRRCGREIRDLLGALIRPRLEAYQAGRATGQRDILAALLEARDARSGQAMTFEELLDQVAMLFLAGHETSASALTWALHLLANAPDVQDRLAAEVRGVIGARLPEAGELREFELARRVFRETLRLFPPVGFLAREAAAPDCMRDKQMAAGSAVVIAPWLIHRHRELWERPDEFDPDRFASPAGRESARQAFLPFGMGPRVCIGAAFAMQEAVLVLAALAQRYRFAPVPGDVPEPVGRLTIRSANGVRLSVRRRALEAVAP
ncbi:MAG: cytochrome P450 [Caldimonas sp.]